MKTEEQRLASAVAASHEAQFNGVDWQTAATDAWQGLPDAMQTEDNYTTLTESPDPGCECRFCKSAKWELTEQ